MVTRQNISTWGGVDADKGIVEVTKKREISSLKKSKESEKSCMGKEK
jgi:hypothetical protein